MRLRFRERKGKFENFSRNYCGRCRQPLPGNPPLQMLPKLGLFKPILEREGEGGRTVPAQKPDGPPRARSRLGMSPARALTVPPGPGRVLTTEPHGRARAFGRTRRRKDRGRSRPSAREQRRPGAARRGGGRGARRLLIAGETEGVGSGWRNPRGRWRRRGEGRSEGGGGRAAAAPRPRWPRRGDPAAVGGARGGEGGGWGRAGAPACGATA